MICSAVLIVASLLSPAPDAEKIKSVVYQKGTDMGEDVKFDFTLSVGLLIAILWIWYYLS